MTVSAKAVSRTTYLDFAPLMSWDDAMRSEMTDHSDAGRRAMLALLTHAGSELMVGFGGNNRSGLENVMESLTEYQVHLRNMASLARVAHCRLRRVADALDENIVTID